MQLRMLGIVATAIMGFSVWASTVHGQCIANEQHKILAPDGESGDYFAIRTALCGDVAAFGAIGDDDGTGSVYVFRFDGQHWVFEQKLTPPDGAPGDNFGNVSIGCDCSLLVIGSYHDDDNGTDSGSVYVYRYDGSGWVLEQKLLASDGASGDDFGNSVAVTCDIIVAGARLDDDRGPETGSAHIFHFDGSSWSQIAKLLTCAGSSPYNYQFGYWADITEDGNVIVIGARDGGDSTPGAVYVFEKPLSGWANTCETAILTSSDGAPGDDFGTALAISEDTIVVGAIEDRDNGYRSGSAYVFEKPESGWSSMNETAKIVPCDGASNDFFGYPVAIDGELILAGASQHGGSGNGKVYAYIMPSGGWADVEGACADAVLVPSDGAGEGEFGCAIALFESTAVIGAHEDNENGYRSGSAYSIVGLGDCNENDTLDICDIADATSADLNDDGIPDECVPQCDADGPHDAECAGATTEIGLDGTASSDPYGDPLEFSWQTDCLGGAFDDPTSPTPVLSIASTATCSLTCGVTLTVTDDDGAFDECSTAVMIVDTLPPMLDVPDDVTIACGDSADPTDTGTATATDLCDPASVVGSSDDIVPTSCPADPIMHMINRTWVSTDSCANADSALQTITVEKRVLPLDIKPGSCPNGFNAGRATSKLVRGAALRPSRFTPEVPPLGDDTSSGTSTRGGLDGSIIPVAGTHPVSAGVLPVTLPGTSDFDVTTVDLATIQLSRADCIGGAVPPLRIQFEDAATPFQGDLCGCHDLRGDGTVDLSMKFSRSTVTEVLELGGVEPETSVPLILSGQLLDGCEFIATDCLWVTP